MVRARAFGPDGPAAGDRHGIRVTRELVDLHLPLGLFRLRNLATEDIDLGGYGEPKGFAPLRQLVRDLLAEQEIAVSADQVLLTQGSSQAMDLVARRLVRPGDAVLVDDPGYPNLLFSLRFLGARLIGVPQRRHGRSACP